MAFFYKYEYTNKSKNIHPCLGHVYYKQRDNVASEGWYIFKAGWRWYASETLGGAVGLRSQETGDLLPPTQNWEYAVGGEWSDDDASLTLKFASLPTLCPVVRVAGEGDVVEKHGKSLGDYRFTLFTFRYAAMHSSIIFTKILIKIYPWQMGEGTMELRQTGFQKRKRRDCEVSVRAGGIF